MRATRFRKGGRPLERGCRKSVGRDRRTKDKATKREMRTRVRCRWGGKTEKRRKWAVVIRAKLFLDDFVTVYSMRPNSRIYFRHAALVRMSSNNSIQWFAEAHFWYGPYVSSYFWLPLSPLPSSPLLFSFSLPLRKVNMWRIGLLLRAVTRSLEYSWAKWNVTRIVYVSCTLRRRSRKLLLDNWILP